MIDLSNVDSQVIMTELRRRGYYIDLIFGISDVELSLENINESREEDKIVLSEDDMRDVLHFSFNTEGFLQTMIECIEEKILSDYDVN